MIRIHKVSLGKGLRARGNVEEWLGKVEEAMFVNLKKILKQSMTDWDNSDRETWLTRWQSQIILTVSQTMWCKEVTEILEGDNQLEDMKDFEKKQFVNLAKLAQLVRQVLIIIYQRCVIGIAIW